MVGRNGAKPRPTRAAKVEDVRLSAQK